MSARHIWGLDSRQMNEMLLEVKNLRTVYGSIHVLNEVNITVEKGKIVCVLGPNGAGKSTLVAAILGLVEIINGTIVFNGYEISGQKTHGIVRRGIGVVPQGKRIFPKMTTVENLRMGAFPSIGQDIVDERIAEQFELFPVLRDRASQVAGTLSGGEQSMLAIGRGLMSNPEIIIFDEPSMGLAPQLVEAVFQIVQDINKRGTTVLMVEQNASMTLEIADYGYVLQKGSIVDSGTGGELEESDYIKAAYLSEGPN